MFNQMNELIKSSLKPVEQLVELNLTTACSLAQQHGALVANVIEDGYTFTSAVSTGIDLPTIVSEQNKFSSDIQSQIFETAKQTINTLGEAQKSAESIITDSFPAFAPITNSQIATKKSAPKIAAKSTPKSKAVSKVATKSAPKAKVTPKITTESATQAKVAPKVEAKSVQKSKPTPKVAAKSAPKSKAAPKAETKSTTKVKVAPKVAAKKIQKSKAAQKVEARSIQKAEIAPNLEAKSTPKAETAPKVEAKKSLK